MMRSVDKDAVRGFWENEACGERYGTEQDRLRYELEPEICDFADFKAAANLRVLEIGVGMGADFLRWVRSGATATGVDLTDRAIALTRQRLIDHKLTAELRVADAEKLPFEDETFDLVYSWGVLHHTPNPSVALQEAQRVLAPGGQLKIMLYHRYSWVALGAWVRFCLLRGKPLAGLHAAVAQVESPGTRAFTRSETQAMLAGLEELSIVPRLSHWDRRLAPVVANLAGDQFGWFLLVAGRKPTVEQGQ